MLYRPQDQLAKVEADKLADKWASLDASSLAQLQQENDQLLARQKAIDPPELLKCIPTLQV